MKKLVIIGLGVALLGAGFVFACPTKAKGIAVEMCCFGLKHLSPDTYSTVQEIEGLMKNNSQHYENDFRGEYTR